MIRTTSWYQQLPPKQTQGQHRPWQPNAITFGKTEHPKADPKPHFGVRNLKHALLTIGSALGVVTTTSLATQDLAGIMRPSRNEPGITQQVAKGLRGTYFMMLSMELFTLMGAAGRRVFSRAIKPTELWKELHDRGITGKNLRIGVVDTGAFPTRGLPPERLEFYTLAQPGSRSIPEDPVGHGTAVANMIAEALPDSKLICIQYDNDSLDQVSQNMAQLLKRGMRDPDAIDMNAIRKAHQETVQAIADSVRLAVNKGANVVNVSLNPEQAVTINLMLVLGQMRSSRRWIKLMSWFSQSAADERKKLDRYYLRLAELFVNKSAENLGKELKTLYKPWVDVLDYAYAKGVPVVLGAGNDGGYPTSEKNHVLGHINPLGMVDHPALIVVGSADSRGIVSNFSSEWNNQRTPNLAGNGSGEIETQARFEQGLLGMLLNPFSGMIKEMHYETPSGTSFAAPDVTATYGMMKAVNPDLTIEEAKTILEQTAGPVRFTFREQLKERRLAEMNLTRQQALKALTIEERPGQILVRLNKEAVPFQDEFLRKLERNKAFALPVTVLANGLELTVPQGLSRLDRQRQIGQLKQSWVKGTGHHFAPTPEAVSREVENALRRRVGVGMLRRLAAVDAAEKSRQDQ